MPCLLQTRSPQNSALFGEAEQVQFRCDLGDPQEACGIEMKKAPAIGAAAGVVLAKSMAKLSKLLFCKVVRVY